MSLPNPPSIIEAKNLKFIIFDAPNDENVDSYIAVREIFTFFKKMLFLNLY